MCYRSKKLIEENDQHMKDIEAVLEVMCHAVKLYVS